MYETIDKLILDAVRASRQTPLYDRAIVAEAKRIADETGREDWRVIDCRIQAMRKAGVIVYLSKAKAPRSQTGWYLTASAK